MLEKRINSICVRLAKKYKRIFLNNEPFYVKNDGTVFNVEGIGDYNCLVIGYANNIEEAKNWMLEDGDLYPLDMDEEEMLKAMIQEIEA